VIVWASATIGAALAFLVGRYVARDQVRAWVAGNPKFAAVDAAIARRGWWIVFLLRLSPVFPFNLLNYALGLTGVRFTSYPLASWVGMLPGTIAYILVGYAGQQALSGNQKVAYWIVAAVATLVATYFITRVATQAIRSATASVGDATQGDAAAPLPQKETPVQLAPPDTYNRTLLANAHPADWQNPRPAGRYNLVVIGAGTAGLVSAAGAAGLGAKVALIERHLLGGDCLNYGCVPSKALIRAARAAADVARAADFGVMVPAGTRVDFAAVMERMRRLRAGISPHDSAERFRGLGVDVFLGDARFVGPAAVEVAGQRLEFAKAVIATGARAADPGIPGLAEVGYLTNETVFSLTELPARLLVLGAGPIGCELAQAFVRFGSEVTLINRSARIMPREDADAAAIVRRQFEREGIRLQLDVKVQRAEKAGAGKRLIGEQRGQPLVLEGEAILVGVGRAPNVEGLGLEAAGVAYDARGVHVDDRLRTSNRRIFAAGDICSPYKFTHAADAMARIAIQNALFLGRKRASSLVIPWCTYTDPEVAHVGLSEKEAQEKGIRLQTFVQELADVDRAILDGETEGFVKVHVKHGSDAIAGATVVARHAGEMISELTQAMVARLGLRTVAATIHPYPTQAEAIKRVGDAYNRTRLTPFAKWLFGKWLTWTR
jgi:pyruvate/2-oxoglutarate dehydrogenase complex dihydrolipoamide dehydrogenase (E3) component